MTEPYLILGMHRCGTSLTASLIAQLGLSLGDKTTLMPASPDVNARGFYEQTPLSGFNESLLHELEGSWDLPPSYKINLQQHLSGHREQARDLLTDCFTNSTEWCWKDPRLSLLLPFWRSLFTPKACIICIRNPLATALSLRKRNGMDLARGMDLWYTYLNRAFRATTDLPRLVLQYEDYFRDPETQLKKLASFLGRPVEADQVLLKTIEKELNHHPCSLQELVSCGDCRYIVQRAYESLVQEGDNSTFEEFTRTEIESRWNLERSFEKERENYLSNLEVVHVALAETREKMLLYRSRLHEASHINEKISTRLLHLESSPRRADSVRRQLQQTKELLEKRLKARVFGRFKRSPILATLESPPREHEIIYSSLRVSGWVFSTVASIESISILLNNKPIKQTRPNLRRSDVESTHPESAGKTQGFDVTVTLDCLLSFLRAGESTLQNLAVRFLDSEGNFLELKRELRLSRPVVQIPRDGQRIQRTFSLDFFSQFAQQLEGSIDYPSFTNHEQPEVSIIIPVHNHWDYTYRCLKSLEQVKSRDGFEILVVNDCSTDSTPRKLELVEGIRVIHNSQNLGFVGSCNRGAEIARGRYLVFLNNDTIVEDLWLEALLQTFQTFPRAGLVGSQLIYPDGRLQEAGSLIWEDGTGHNIGRLDDPNRPDYCYARQVDYCSGASLMIRKELWDQIGGFDELYAPAYYEDVELAFQVASRGLEVYYQPNSRVIHFEGITCGTEPDQGMKRYQGINREKFRERWKERLLQHRAPLEKPSIRESDRRGRILYIDDRTPQPDKDAGSLASYHFLTLLRQLGFAVTFLPISDYLHYGDYTKALQGRGVECWYAPYLDNLQEFFRDRATEFDAVFLCRAPIASECLPLIKEYAPSLPILFETIDLHALRQERRAAFLGTARERKKAALMKELEHRVMRTATRTLVVSLYEQKYLAKVLPEIESRYLPFPVRVRGRPTGGKHRNLVFIGGFSHPPNVAAVKFLTNEVWPLVQKRLPPECKLQLVGPNPTEEVVSLASDSVEVIGYVENLESTFADCRLTVAPILYGAGIKGKVLTSLSYGIPCVATPVATEGTGLRNGDGVLIADNAASLAKAIVELYSNQKLWNELSEAGIDALKKGFSEQRVSGLLDEILSELGL